MAKTNKILEQTFLAWLMKKWEEAKELGSEPGPGPGPEPEPGPRPGPEYTKVDGKKKAWTSPSLSEDSLLEGMIKLVDRKVARALSRGTGSLKIQESTPVVRGVDPFEPSCEDPDCCVCADNRRYQLALLNAQVILDDVYRRARN